MATVVYRDAYLIVGGAQLQGEFTELAVEAGAESLDNTTFGAATRIHKGGLLMGTISGTGLMSLGANSAEEILNGLMQADDTLVICFPNGITEGSPTTGRGYAMLSVVDQLTLGGAVGTLLQLTFRAEGRNPN